MAEHRVTLGYGYDGTERTRAGLQIDVPVLIDTRVLVTASSGQGKSYALRKLIELVAKRVQVIVIDPDGDFNTLREKLDMVLVGPGGEIKPEVRTAKLLARKLAELRVSAILDIYEIGDWDERRSFVAEFLSGLMSLPKDIWHAMLVAIDEAHNFAPESYGGKAGSPASRSRAAINYMMSAGRKHGIGGVLATQRISKLSKDAIADAKNVFVGGITLDIDQQRAGDILGFSSRADRLGLRDLIPGEFYCFGPAIVGRGVGHFRVGDVETTHPRPGRRHLVKVPPASSAIQKIVASLADLPAQVDAEENDLQAAQAEVQVLRRKLAESARPVSAPVPDPALAARVADLQAQLASVKPVEVPVFRDGEIDRLDKVLSEVRGLSIGLSDASGALATIAGKLTTEAGNIGSAIRQAVAVAARPSAGPKYPPAPGRAPEAVLAPSRPGRKPRFDPGPMETARANIDAAMASVEPPAMNKGMQAILDAMARLQIGRIRNPPRRLIALVAGASARSGNFGVNLAALQRAGLIDFPISGHAALTDDGRSYAKWETVAPNADDLQRDILARLGGGRAAILRVLLGAYPDPMLRNTIAAEVNVSPKSGNFGVNLGYLKKASLIEFPSAGYAVASPLLFLNNADHD